MAVVKFFVNDVKRQLHKAEISREGSRAIDQAKISVPPETPIESSDQVTYVQDMVSLDANRLLFNFCQHIKDESGYKHNAIGHTDFPSACSFWDFQNAFADTGKDQNTTIVVCGCATYAAGKVRCTGATDRAFLFDGTRHLSVDSTSLDYDFRQDTKWTVSTWFFPTAMCVGVTPLMSKKSALTGVAGWHLLYDTDCAKVQGEIASACTDFNVTSANCSITLCMWNHAALTYAGQTNLSGMKLYINGELASTGTCTAIPLCPTVVNMCCLVIGAMSDGTLQFTGRMDGTYSFTKELDLCAIKSLYYDGALEYVSGLWDGRAVEFDGETGHTTIEDKAPADPRPDNLKLQLKLECNLTDSSCTSSCITMVAGCETYTCGLVDDKSFIFDNTNYFSISCMNYNFITGTCPFTVAFWMKAPCGANDCFIGIRDGISIGNCGWHIRRRNGGDLRFEASDGVAELNIITSSKQFTDNTWHHAALTYNGCDCGTGLTWYVDGVFDKKGVTFACSPSCWNNCNILAVGAQADGGQKFCGQLDCIRVWDKELTAKEVKNLHDSTYGAAFRGPYEIITWVKAPLAACCDRTIFHKSSSCTTGVELSLNGTAGGGQGFTVSGYTASGFQTGAGCAAACAVFWRHNSTTLTSCTDITDCCWHQIRVTRDACNLISLYVDNVLEDCSTDATCPICDVNAEFGRDNAMCEFFDGAISSFRMYSCNLSSVETCNLFTLRNPRSNVKFGGESTKVERMIGHKKIVTASFGKQLGEVEVRAVQFCMRTPEYILRTLVKDNTDLDTHFHGIESGITLCSYQADGKLVDVANDLSQLTGKVYRTDGLGQFHLHDEAFVLTTASFNHQVNMTNIVCGKDDAEVVNCLLIIGENKRFTTSCTFCGDGTTTVFTLAQSPVTARVFSPAACCTELTPEEDYEVNTATKTLTFDACMIPGMCTTALIEYEFEQPLNIRGENSASIADIGIKAKRLVLPWITTRTDGTRFITAYLENFKDVKFRTTATIPGLSNGIGENDVVTFTNKVKGVEGSFIIKSLTWRYPEATTTLELGEFNFQMLEFAKQITEKIHDLESAVVRVKDLRDFEAPQEVLVLIDTQQVFEIADQGLQFFETLALGDSQTVTEQFDASYDACCTTYDGDDAYT